MQLDILLIPFGFYGMVWWDGVPHENGIKNQWPFQEPKLEVSTIYEAYIRPMQGNIPTKYGLIWYSTSILGS